MTLNLLFIYFKMGYNGELMYWVNCVIGFIFGSLNYVNSMSTLPLQVMLS